MSEFSRRRFFKMAGGLAGASLLSGRELAAKPAGEAQRKITIACSDYLRYTPLATGDVRPKEVDLTWVRAPRSEVLRRVLAGEVDGGETSMLGHLLRMDRGDDSFVAVPAFLLRNFTARDIYTRNGLPLAPEDLKGRRIGIYNWTASGAVWYRHFVRYLGQDPAEIQWIVGGTDVPRKVQARAPLPRNVTDAASDKSLTDLLLAGEIDAVFAPIPPKQYRPTRGPIVRLFPEFRSVEQRYFEKTRCYPTQHVLVVRKPVWEQDPSVGRRLLKVLNACEERFQEGLHHFPYATPWQMAEVEATDLLMGRDFHAHGLDRNRHEVEVFCQAAFDDGLTKRRVTVEEYFAEFVRAS